MHERDPLATRAIHQRPQSTSQSIGPADDPQRGIWRDGIDQVVNTLVRKNPADEQDGVSGRLACGWREAGGVDAAENHARVPQLGMPGRRAASTR